MYESMIVMIHIHFFNVKIPIYGAEFYISYLRFE